MMAVRSLPDIDYLRQLIWLDDESGMMFWLVHKDRTNQWNGRYGGTPALFNLSSKGYRQGTLLGQRGMMAHRVVWALYYGYWPAGEIDHINGVRSDNRIINLRDVSHAENGKNQKKQIRNTSGVTGVSWIKPLKKWRSRIHHSGKNVNLGYFLLKHEAVAARKCAEVRYGYNCNHGRPM